MSALERRKVLVVGSWLVSAIVHFLLTATAALVLRPAGDGRSSASTLIVSWSEADSAELELATFTGASLAADLAPESAADAETAFSARPAGADPALEGELSLLIKIEPLDFETEAPPLRDEPIFQAVELPSPSLASPNRREATPDEPPPAARAEFFGTTAQGDRFVFVLDMSGSMEGSKDDEGRSRFARARAELLRSVDRLHERQGFYVILFSDSARPMPTAGGVRRIVPATAANKERLKDWLLKVSPQGGTNPNQALSLGVELAPHAIFLLSDGVFDLETAGQAALLFRKTPDGRQEIIERADERLIPIHSIAYEDASGAKNMQELSSKTGGSYRFIDPNGAEEFIPAPGALPPLRPSDPQAARLLAAARLAESRRHYRQALADYRRIEAQFADTAEGVAAAEGVLRLTKRAAPPAPSR